MVARKPGHQGERVISRRTIVQGMPGRFRRTCGHYRVHHFFAHGPRVRRASGIPCALMLRIACALDFSRAKTSCKTRARRAARSRTSIWATHLRMTMPSSQQSRRHRARVTSRPSSGFDQRNEALDHFIEQCGLFEIEHMAGLRKKRQAGSGKVLLQEQAGLNTGVVLVAADDQGRRRHLPDRVGQGVDRGPAALEAAHGVGGAFGIRVAPAPGRNPHVRAGP